MRPSVMNRCAMAVCLFTLASCAANAGAESSANATSQETIEEPATLSLAELRQTYAVGSSKSVNVDGVDLYFSDEGDGPTV